MVKTKIKVFLSIENLRLAKVLFISTPTLQFIIKNSNGFSPIKNTNLIKI